MWRELTAEQQLALQQLAQGEAVGSQHVVDWLAKAGLVERENRQLFSPIFARFVQAATPVLPPIRLVGTSGVERNGRLIITTGKVYRGEEEIHVTPLELRLLACLKQTDKVHSKDEIAKYVYFEEWETYEAVNDSRIENLIRQVRRKVGGDYIKAHWGQGYELLA